MRSDLGATVALTLALALAPATAFGLEDEIDLPGCAVDAELATALVEPPELGRECGDEPACWRDGLARARALRERFPASYDAHRAYVLDVRAAARVLGDAPVEEAAAEYRRWAAERPGNPAYRHLLAQMSSEGADYRRELEALGREFPGYPWAQLSIAYLARGGFPEDLAARAEEGLERFVEICPGRVAEIGRALQSLGGRQGAAERLARLRSAAVERGDLEALASLWKLVLGLAGEAGAEETRAQIANDLVEIESRESVTDLDALSTLLEGHRMAQDPIGADRIEERLIDLHPCSEPARRARAARYVRDFPLRGALPGADREPVDPRARALVESELAACPDDPWALARRIAILRREPDASPDDLVAAVDRLAGLGAIDALGVRWPELWQAELWLDLGIRTEQVEQLLAGAEATEAGAVAERREWERRRLVARLSLARGELDSARAALAGLEAALAEPARGPATPAERRSLDLLRAEIERAAGRPEAGLDLLGLWLAEEPATPAIEWWARRLWAAAHGGTDGYGSWRRERSSLAPSQGPWRAVDRPFPAIDLHELGGGPWPVPDAERRVLFLRSWAAWCAPCREEAPVVERLVTELAERGDILFAYLSVDPSASDVVGMLARGENPPLGFLVGGHALLGDELPCVPSSWIVDGGGRIVAIQEGAATDAPEAWLEGARAALLGAVAAGRDAPPAE